MNPPPSPQNRWVSLIEAMDRPLLVLAIVTMALYLLELHGLFGPAQATVFVVTLLIDLAFVFDLALKLAVLGKDYIRTPWFLIDLLSCLPVLDVLALGALHFRAIRFVRGFRILRILRGLRVLRVLRSIPAFDQFLKEAPSGESTRRFHRAINLAMVALTVVVLLTIVVVRQQFERETLDLIDEALAEPVSLAHLHSLGGGFTPPGHSNYVARSATVDGRSRIVYLDLTPVDERANEVEFFLILGMMFSTMLFMYIMAFHQLDVTQAQLRALLHLALPRQVADRFLIDPSAYDERARTPATIVFMDFTDFTRTCEHLARDPNRLAAHMERAMQRLVDELARNDMIVDKYIGDAVMSFRGGPLVSGGPREHAYRAVRSAVEAARALEALNDPFFHRVKIGGASANDCLIGAFGTTARLSYTILGDGVNLAARLEPASEQCGTRNLFCATTHRLCDGRADILWRRWGRIRVHGKSGPVEVFEAFDAESLGDAAFLATFRRALEAFERRDFARACEDFRLADAQRGGDGDKPSRIYLAWCLVLLADAPPDAEELVFETHK